MVNNLPDIDKIVHDPVRLQILAYLNSAQKADFLYLQRTLELTKGNLSSHISKMESVGYVKVEKTYIKKIPLTIIEITDKGRQAFEKYKKEMNTFLTDQ